MLLAPLLACSPASTAMTAVLRPDATARLQVWVFSLDGKRAPANVAHAFSSLDAHVIDGELVLAGLQSAAPPSRMEEMFPRLFVDALTTSDLTSWSSRRWYIDAPGRSVIDPAFADGPDGLELWFAQADGTGDPARLPTKIVRTRRAGDGFGQAEVYFSGQRLVDPSPVWIDGAWHVFATRDHAEVVEISGTPPVVTPRIPGATVPHARVVDGGITLTAQKDIDGRRMPVRTRWDGHVWSPAEPVPLAGAGGLRTCASPVTETFAGDTILACVDER